MMRFPAKVRRMLNSCITQFGDCNLLRTNQQDIPDFNLQFKEISTVSPSGMQKNLNFFPNLSVQARLGVVPEKPSKIGYLTQVIKAFVQVLPIYTNTN